MKQLKHLSDESKEIMRLSISNRIYNIKNGYWIGYPRANNILSKLEIILNKPVFNPADNFIISGKNKTGKSQLAVHFRNLHLAHVNPHSPYIVAPVIDLELSQSSNLYDIYGMILDRLLIPYKLSWDTVKLEELTTSTLKNINTRVIILDDIHHLFSESNAKFKQIWHDLQQLSTNIQVSIIGVWNEDHLPAINNFNELANLISIEKLVNFNFDKDYLEFLYNFEKYLPLKDPSNLIGKRLSTEIYESSEGNIDKISEILLGAAEWAIMHTKPGNPERITKDAVWFYDHTDTIF